jgi:IMP dehydrogenase
MATIYEKEQLTFGDVLLKPSYSDIKSRSEVNLSVKIKNFTFSNPLIPANMKSIMSIEMCRELYKAKSLGLMHRFSSIEDQLNLFSDLKLEFGWDIFNYIGCSIGVKQEDYENLHKFIKLGLKIFCIDIAHGHSKECGNLCNYIKSKYPSVLLIAGNVATKEGADYLWDCGADVVKCGIGASGICTTRLKAGAGVPQLSAIEDAYNNIKQGKYLISDGGIRQVGDFVKALAFSDMVMCGNMFSGCEETPEDIMEIDGVKYKKYAGSSTHKTTHIEGVVSLVHIKGKYKDLLEEYSQGIKSGLSYAGAQDLNVFKRVASFVKITNASIAESGVHDVKVIG